jgi:stage II sporulation protein M
MFLKAIKTAGVPYNMRMQIPKISIESIRNNYRNIWKDLQGILPLVLISVAVFLAGIAAGLVYPHKFASLFSEFSKSTSHLFDRGFIVLAVLIFLRNSFASLIAISFGIFFGLVPVTAAFVNGALIGTVLSGIESARIFAALIVLLPHGIFELPALFISWGLGIWIGIFVLTKKQQTFISRQKSAYRIFFFVVLPLLLVAAIIEGSSIALLRMK